MQVTSPEANALRHPPFVFYWLALWAASFAVQIMSVSVGWQVYDISRDPLDLGFVGLAQFLPRCSWCWSPGLRRTGSTAG